jgi:hypothetical protein
VGIEELRFVRSPSQVCELQGCQFLIAQQALATAQKMGRAAQMIEAEDVALWCGVGGHSFGQLDPGRQKVTVQQWDEESQEMKPVKVSACGEHARPVAIQTRPKALTNGNGSVTDPAEAAKRGYDPAYVAWLEQQAKQPIGEAGTDGG